MFVACFSAGWRFSEIAPSPRAELQTRAVRQLVPDRFSRPLHLWPNGGTTAQTLRPALVSEAFADEHSGVAERPAAGFQMRVPQVPRMNHVWPDLQRHAHIGGTGCGGEARGVREQRLCRTHLD